MGSGVVVRSTLRAVPATTPDPISPLTPFHPHMQDNIPGAFDLAEPSPIEPKAGVPVKPPEGISSGRFSLKWMLLVVTLCASLIGNAVSSIRLRQAINERDRLRREVGYLEMGAPDQVSAARVPTDEPLTWRYKVRIPEGETYRIVCSTIWPAEAGQPRWTGGQSLKAGEHALTLRILSDPRDDRWKLVSVVRSGDNILRFSVELDERQTKLFRTSNDTLNLGINSQTVHIGSDQRLRMLDQRWLSGEGGMLLYGDRPPRESVDGVFLELQPDNGPLNGVDQ